MLTDFWHISVVSCELPRVVTGSTYSGCAWLPLFTVPPNASFDTTFHTEQWPVPKVG